MHMYACHLNFLCLENQHAESVYQMSLLCLVKGFGCGNVLPMQLYEITWTMKSIFILSLEQTDKNFHMTVLSNCEKKFSFIIVGH